jgi:putative sigma-54 modulation protein
VVRSKQFNFGLMPVEEAILQMNLIGHAFFAFRNEDKDGAFSVVYRRRNGGYGILTDKE